MEMKLTANRFRFRLVSLHIQSLCNPAQIKTEENVVNALKRLPKGLDKSYDVILDQIANSQDPNPGVAERALKWLICAKHSLKTAAFIDAIGADGGGHASPLSNADVLSICGNLVVLDSEQDVFRFAHLSVREYLERREEYNLLAAHILALARCLEVITSEIGEFEERRSPRSWKVTSTGYYSKDMTLRSPLGFGWYAFSYWPMHYQAVDAKPLPEKLRLQLREFLFKGQKSGHSYTKWILLTAVGSSCGDYEADEEYLHSAEYNVRALYSVPPTPLFLACRFGLVSLMEDLKNWSNTDWNQRNNEGTTALYLAAEYGHLAVVQMLLNKGAKVNDQSEYGTALHAASRAGHNNIVLHLLRNDADLEAKDKTGSTSLFHAAQFGHKQAVQLLLEKGANVQARGLDGSALHIASGEGYIEIVRILLKEGSSLETVDVRGDIALIAAVAAGKVMSVRLLLEAGANARTTDPERRTALHRLSASASKTVTVSDNFLPIARLLVEHGADVNAIDELGNTPLHIIIGEAWRLTTSSGSDRVEKFLELGPSLEIRNSSGLTPLQTANSALVAENAHGMYMRWREYYDGLDESVWWARHNTAYREIIMQLVLERLA